MTIVLYGVGTDYIVFLLFRYRERLRAGDDPKQALVTAVARIGEVIASAAAAIMIAFSALLLAVFAGFRSFGPGLVISVALMALAVVTLVPAVVSLLGTKVFWPSKSWQHTPRGSTFQRLGRFTARRPAAVALASFGVMGALALGVRHGDVPGAQRHGLARAQGLVAGPRRRAGRTAARACRARAGSQAEVGSAACYCLCANWRNTHSG